MSAEGNDLAARSESYRLALGLGDPSAALPAQSNGANPSQPQRVGTLGASTSKDALLPDGAAESNRHDSIPIFDQTTFYDRFTFRYVLPLLRLGASTVMAMDDIPKASFRLALPFLPCPIILTSAHTS